MRTAGRGRWLGAMALGLVCLLALVGCAPAGSSIIGNWRLVSGHDSMGALPLGKSVVTLKIHGAKSGGQGPCNYYGAPIEGSTTGSIQVNVGVVTSLGCLPTSRMTLESRYFDDLNGQMGAVRSNGRLTLTSGSVVLVFARATTT